MSMGMGMGMGMGMCKHMHMHVPVHPRTWRAGAAARRGVPTAGSCRPSRSTSPPRRCPSCDASWRYTTSSARSTRTVSFPRRWREGRLGAAPGVGAGRAWAWARGGRGRGAGAAAVHLSYIRFHFYYREIDGFARSSTYVIDARRSFCTSHVPSCGEKHQSECISAVPHRTTGQPQVQRATRPGGLISAAYERLCRVQWFSPL